MTVSEHITFLSTVPYVIWRGDPADFIEQNLAAQCRIEPSQVGIGIRDAPAWAAAAVQFESFRQRVLCRADGLSFGPLLMPICRCGRKLYVPARSNGKILGWVIHPAGMA